MFTLRSLLAAALLAAGFSAPWNARADDRAGMAFFEEKIRPALVEHCYECHSAELKSPKGGLLVDSRAGLRQGGDSGAAVVPGKGEESLLLSALRYESFEMPPKGRLPQSVVDDFEQWIKLGAPDPRDGKLVARKGEIDLEAGRRFWAFQPPRAHTPPRVEHESWSATDVDRFILARLEAEGLAPVEDANRRSLVRRLYFDLIGLPPPSAQIDAFLADPSPHALEALVDRLLASGHFGERWGRHWLDVARYSDSTGGGRTKALDNAWRYRDYVIRAFNNDKPYNQFVSEQIAGDLLPYDSPEQRRDQLIASGFLVLGPNNYENQDKELLRMEVVDEQISTVGKAFLAMTLGCARCHDHKFDPIPTRDYYALAGIFRSTKTLTPGNVSGFVQRPLPLDPQREQELAAGKKKLEAAQAEVDAAKSDLAGLQDRLKQLASQVPLPGTLIDDRQAKITGQWQRSTYHPKYVGNGYLHDMNAGKGEKSVEFSVAVEEPGLYELRLASTPGTNRAVSVPVTIVTSEGKSQTVQVNQQPTPPIRNQFIPLGRFAFQPERTGSVTVSNRGTSGHVIADGLLIVSAQELEAGKAEKKSDPHAAKRAALRKQIEQQEAQLEKLNSRLAAIKKQTPPQPMCMAVQDEAQPADWHVHIRGEIRNLGSEVPRSFLQVAMQSGPPEIEPDESGRRELAHWIASADNPLTARVWVNRVWHHLFGAGLVRTTDNFGATGERPSHPELLDYLATQFINDDWSTKALIRRLVLSRVYRLSSNHNAAAKAADPENRLLWRMNRKRLDAEALRDAMLAISGELDRRAGGPSIRPENKGNGKIEYGYRFTTKRRSVYVPIFRNTLLELFSVFDFADPNRAVGNRTTSTLPTQSLYLMNHPFVLEQSEQIAQLLLELEMDDAARVERAYERILGRPPTAAERDLALEYLASPGAASEPDRTSAESPPRASEQAIQERVARWTGFCQALLGSLDFRYLN